jgi:hypothetical protein
LAERRFVEQIGFDLSVAVGPVRWCVEQLWNTRTQAAVATRRAAPAGSHP